MSPLLIAPTEWKQNDDRVEAQQHDYSTNYFAIVSGQTASDPNDAYGY